jgi:hypothetical protein
MTKPSREYRPTIRPSTTAAIAALLAAVMLTGNAFGGEIYSCVDKGGKKRIQTNPCSNKEKTIHRQVFTESSQQVAPGKVDPRTGLTVPREPTEMERAIAAQERYVQRRQQANIDAAHAASGGSLKAFTDILSRLSQGAGGTAPPQPANTTPNQFTAPQAVPSVIAPPPIIEPPPVIVNCDQAGCWDTSGKRYNHGAGPTFFRSDGKTCNSVPGFMNCN